MQQLLFNHRGAVTAFRLGALGVRSWAGCLGRGGGVGRCRGGGDCLICFCLIFDCYYGFFFFMKGEWVLGSAFTQVWYFSTVSLFLRMLCLKLPSNLCTMLFIQDIKYRFTCG